METLTKSEVQIRRDELLQRIADGEVFIHPTDTIYGLGCNATDEKAVKAIRKLKERQDTAFSIWVPSKEWVLENCVVTKETQAWLDKLPGPYTVVVKIKNKSALAKSVNPIGDTVGIRLPSHWFSVMVERLGVPIVTTSANRTGHMFMSNLEDLDEEIRKGVRFAIYEGEKKGKPSTIIDLVNGKVKDRVK